jgi:dTDP-3-amino-3,4,6-trideoxy-alpha-D-glucopyranose N,N-dimethyltransferase/N-dimethyltransferase
MGYRREVAEVYDDVFRSRGKDFEAEATLVTELVLAASPAASSLLDVACGTGAHLETFRKKFRHVAGVELAQPMIEVAGRRLPGVDVHSGDMRDFHLDERFDAVTCLFSAIGYMHTEQELAAAVRCMAGHLEPGGVLVIEPWWFPERFIDGYVAGDVARVDGKAIARLSHTRRDGMLTQMTAKYLVADRAGITEFHEYDVLRLFTREQYLEAFAKAGCPARYLPDSPTGRGFLIGTKARAGDTLMGQAHQAPG